MRSTEVIRPVEIVQSKKMVCGGGHRKPPQETGEGSVPLAMTVEMLREEGLLGSPAYVLPQSASRPKATFRRQLRQRFVVRRAAAAIFKCAPGARSRIGHEDKSRGPKSCPRWPHRSAILKSSSPGAPPTNARTSAALGTCMRAGRLRYRSEP